MIISSFILYNILVNCSPTLKSQNIITTYLIAHWPNQQNKYSQPWYGYQKSLIDDRRKVVLNVQTAFCVSVIFYKWLFFSLVLLFLGTQVVPYGIKIHWVKRSWSLLQFTIKLFEQIEHITRNVLRNFVLFKDFIFILEIW